MAGGTSADGVGIRDVAGYFPGIDDVEDALQALGKFKNGGSLPSVAYRIITPDGINVFAYDKTGTAIYTGADAGAAVTACLPAASSEGATIAFRNDGFVFPWASVPALPKGITNKLLIVGNGATVQLSAAAPRLFDFNKTADYDTFQNIEITDLVLDKNNIAGPQTTLNEAGGFTDDSTFTVTSTANFAAAGQFQITEGSTIYAINYTGKTATTFTGCTTSAGHHSLTNGDTINQGKMHIILGTLRPGLDPSNNGSSFQFRLNLTNITLRRITIVNAPTDPTGATVLYGAYFFTVHQSASESTATSVTNILCEDVVCNGANECLAAGVTNSGGSANSTNASWDKITYERCRYVGAAVPTASGATEGFQIGSLGHGGTGKILNCYAQNCADAGFEINSATVGIHENCVAVDCFNKGFMHENYDTPSNPNGQVISWVNCHAHRYNTTAGEGWTLLAGNSIAAGKLVLTDCSWHKNQANIDSAGEAFKVASNLIYAELEIRGFKAISEGWSCTASPTPSLFDLRGSSGGSYASRVLLRDIHTSYTGTVTSGTCTRDHIHAFGTFGRFEIDGHTWEENVTSAPAGSGRALVVGTSTATIQSGKISRQVCLGITGDSAPRGIVLGGTSTLTISTTIEISGNDWSQLPSAHEILFTATSVVANTRIRGNVWKTIPAPVNFTGLSTGVGAALAQGWDAIVTFKQATGTSDTAIDYSTNGGTTYTNFLTQASGALPSGFDQSLGTLTSDALIKVTFTGTQPTITLVPVNP